MFVRSSLSALALLCASLSPITALAQSSAGADVPSAVVPPRLLHQPDLRLEEDGTASRYVELEITVWPSGRATDASLVDPSGDALESRALEAVDELRFAPARRDGEPIAVRIRYRVVFRPMKVVAPEPAPPPPAVEPEEVLPPVASELDALLEDESYTATAEVERPAREVTRHSLDAEELQRVPGTRGDPVRAIEVLPGVGRTGFGDGAPRLRGSAPFDSMVLIDDDPVPSLYHFGGLTSVVQPGLLQRVDLYPGNFSARYGRRGGGVVSATLRDPKNDGFHGMVDLNAIDASVRAEGPLAEGVAVVVGARRSLLDLYFGAFVPEDTYALIAAPVYYDYQALLRADLGDDHVLRVSAIGSHDSLELFFDEPPDDAPSISGGTSARQAFYRGRVSLDSQLSPAWKQHFSVSYGVIDQLFNIGGTASEALDHRINGRLDWMGPLASNLHVSFGGDFLGQVVHGTYSGERPPQTEGDPTIGSPDNGKVEVDDLYALMQPAAFVELRYRPTPGLLLQPGLRLDYYSQLARVSVDPRLVARWTVVDGTVLKGGLGLYSQPPVYWESATGLGNEDLDVSRALHSSLGIEQALPGRTSVHIEGFYKHIFDRVVATDGGVAPFFINDGAGRIFGTELGVRARPLDGMSIYLAYTMSRSERSDRGAPFRLFDEDQTHNLSTAFGYHWDNGWGVGARFRLVSGNSQTPVVGSVFNANVARYTPIFGGINSVRASLFHQLDLNAEKKWSFESWSLTAYASVLNVYNHQAEEGRQYSYDYRESQVVTGLPLFPSLGIRGEL